MVARATAGRGLRNLRAVKIMDNAGLLFDCLGVVVYLDV